MGTKCRAPHWVKHEQFGITYDLAHLHPFYVQYILPKVEGKNGRPGFVELQLHVFVSFSHHCFSRSQEDVVTFTTDETYEDTSRGEVRIFCKDRWELSKKLSAIFRQGMGRKCFHTGRHNFFTVELNVDVASNDYTVYFTANQSSHADVHLHIESAYLRGDKPHLSKSVGKIGMNAILRNALRGNHPHPPPK
jgi:hypothetical protein